MVVLINCHSREYSRFNYGNELFFPIIISSGMLSLMSFVIDCAVFTSFFFFFDSLEIFFCNHSSHGGFTERYISAARWKERQRQIPVQGRLPNPF